MKMRWFGPMLLRIGATAAAFLATPAYADCPPWHLCQLENAKNDVVVVVKDTVETAKDAVTAAAGGVKDGVVGAAKILRGAAELATGRPGEAWESVKEGGQQFINGVVEVSVAAGTTVVTMADPLIGRVFFGTPSPMQALAKFLYDTIAQWKGRPTCNSSAEVERFMKVPKRELDETSRVAGALTTPLKYLSSIFDGLAAWQDTGCNASGIGRPVRDAQHSTDGFYTLDVAVSDIEVNGQHVPPGRYVRLEVFPGLASHDSMRDRAARMADVIRFSGPLMWDKDHDTDHPDGHMEIHPTSAIEFGQAYTPPSPQPTAVTQNAVDPTRQDVPAQERAREGASGQGLSPLDPPAAGASGYKVVRGDNLSRIAARIYGRQRWRPIFCSNRGKILNPDLIYPGQHLYIPVSTSDIAARRCDIRGVPR